MRHVAVGMRRGPGPREGVDLSWVLFCGVLPLAGAGGGTSTKSKGLPQLTLVDLTHHHCREVPQEMAPGM